MKTPLLALFVSLALTAACGGSSGGAANSPTSTSSSAMLSFGEITFYAGAGDGTPGPVMHADGTVTGEKNTLICALSADGAVRMPSGKLIMQVQADGKLMAGTGKVIGMISPDGVLTLPKGGDFFKGDSTFTLAFDDAGNLTGMPGEKAHLHVKGLTPSTRRAAMLAFLYMMFAVAAEETVNHQ